jgi:formylglycine-generating enzyme required for sulfatase activity
MEPSPLMGQPDHVSRAILSGLSKQPEDRPADAGKLVEMLSASPSSPPAASEPDAPAAPEPPAPAAVQPSLASQAGGSLPAPKPTSGARLWWISASILAVLSVVGVLIGVAAFSGSESQGRSSTRSESPLGGDSSGSSRSDADASRVSAARTSYESALAGHDLDRLRSYGGSSWREVERALARARSSSRPSEAASAYGEAERLLSAAARAAEAGYRREQEAAASRREQERFDSHMDRARSLLSSGNAREALSSVSAALSMRSGDTSALSLKRRIESELAKPELEVYSDWPFDSAEARRRQQETARALGVPVEKTLDLGGGVKLELVLIPAGEFVMGSPADENGRDDDEGPQRRVTLSRPFYLGKTEVTREQFAQFVSDSGYKTEAEKEGMAWGWNGGESGVMAGYSWRKTGFTQGGDHPVVNVSWNDVTEFCSWLGRRTGQAVRLPLEAQWEYACRAGTKTAYLWGDDPDDGEGWANGADQTAKGQFSSWTCFSWKDGYVFTSPAGKFKPNAFGLYDMHGNVWEWCQDWYADKYDPKDMKDPKGPNNGSVRVLRGGSWIYYPHACRSANRSWGTPGGRGGNGGFRVVVSLGPGLR